MLKGIDISNWQGTVDCSKVKASGYDVVYIKATEGMHTLDSYLESHYETAKLSGMKIGFYHFLQGNESGVDQANWMYSNIKDKDFDCKIAIDVEVTNGATPSELSQIVVDFAEQITKLTGKEVVVYTYTNFANTSLDSSLSKYPLWVADYGVSKPAPNNIWGENYIGWQYTSAGQVNGCPVGNTDLDQFSEAILLSESYTAPVVKKQQTEAPKISSPYKVGEKVMVIGTVYATGQDIPSFVRGNIYPIIQVDEDKVLLGGGIDSWVYNSGVETVSHLKVGDTVKVIGENYATGQVIPTWVKNQSYPIIQVNDTNSEVLLGGGIDSWVYESDVKVVGFEVGQKVRVIADNYATGQAIPAWVKSEEFTIIQIDSVEKKALLGDGLDSWIYESGLILA